MIHDKKPIIYLKCYSNINKMSSIFHSNISLDKSIRFIGIFYLSNNTRYKIKIPDVTFIFIQDGQCIGPIYNMTVKNERIREPKLQQKY